MMKKRRLIKRFRFQLLCEWLVNNYLPCKAIDVGGGKGVLAYLLNKHGWQATVVEPIDQKLPLKLKDLQKNKIKISDEDAVPRINKNFEKEMAKDFDLLIGLHAHGSNMKIIEAAKQFNKNFVIFPCCVVGEPIIPQPNINWLDSLEDYAKSLGFEVGRVTLNFKGQNVGLYNRRSRD